MKCLQTDGKMDDRQLVHVFSKVPELSSQFSNKEKKRKCFIYENMIVVEILHDDIIMIHKTSIVLVPYINSEF